MCVCKREGGGEGKRERGRERERERERERVHACASSTWLGASHLLGFGWRSSFVLVIMCSTAEAVASVV